MFYCDNTAIQTLYLKAAGVQVLGSGNFFSPLLFECKLRTEGLSCQAHFQSILPVNAFPLEFHCFLFQEHSTAPMGTELFRC